MADQTKTALDAMSEALAPQTETPVPDTSKDEKEDDSADESEAVAEADGGDVGEGEPDATKPDAGGAADDAAGGKPDAKVVADTAGKKAAKDADGKPAELTAEEKAAADKKPAADPAAKKPTDPLNDPIPATVSERTRERITSLIGTVKEQQTEITRGRELFQAIESTGMGPEELGTMLTYARLVHSDKVEDKRTAFNFLQGELRGLALQLGETTAGVNILDDYPDLKEQLESGAITEKVANEVALSRERAKVETANAARQNETATELQAARTKGIADMDELGQTLKAVDPQYDAKAAVLIPKLQPLLAKMHPSQWVAHFRKEYTAFKLPAVPGTGGASASVGNPPAGGVKPQPLRPGQPSGNSAAQPSSAREAMDAALSGMGR